MFGNVSRVSLIRNLVNWQIENNYGEKFFETSFD